MIRWELMGELAAGPEWHSQLPGALSSLLVTHSRLPKQQSKATVTRSGGERLQLGDAAGLTGH